MERWLSGRKHTPAKGAYVNSVSRVRIPPSPPTSKELRWQKQKNKPVYWSQQKKLPVSAAGLLKQVA